MFRASWKPRYVIVCLCFLATFSIYADRVGFSIAFTRMAKKVGLEDGIKGTVLSAFYWGYALSQVPLEHQSKPSIPVQSDSRRCIGA